MIYPGRFPMNVAKDAKYSVVHGGKNEMHIRLIYRLNAGEKALVTTSGHPELVKMVNACKTELSGMPGGAFYINEYQHVLVPSSDGCHYAGTYKPLLEFEFEGQIINPKAPASLKPGDKWPGPRPGISYVLTADGQDIKYEQMTRPNVISEIRLSIIVGKVPARKLAMRLSGVKHGGGRIYINEAREIFSPIQTENEFVHTYLGHLGDDPWFPCPDVESLSR